ncbi:unnamed protein product [Closterium sp. Naga37s-1]|nr:unnamed protein product [Closterium sp. Naga37s-1]
MPVTLQLPAMPPPASRHRRACWARVPRFLPAFERIGRVCHVYLTPSDVFLLHNVLSADGVQAIAQFPTAELFSEHLISSASADRIAFSLDLSLLARALRSSLATAATRHQLKLVKKSTNPTAPALPFLSLEAKGERSSIVQDIPISTPLPRSQLNELQAGIDLVHSLPETLVQLPDLPSLRHLVERLQSVGDMADVATMRSGALAMRTHTPSITVAAQFKNLKVFGANSESQQSGAGVGEGSRQRGGTDDDADISGLSTWLRQMQATGDATVVVRQMQATGDATVVVRQMQATGDATVVVRQMQATGDATVVVRQMQATGDATVVVRQMQATDDATVVVRQMQATGDATVVVRQMQATGDATVVVRQMQATGDATVVVRQMQATGDATVVVRQMQATGDATVVVRQMQATGDATVVSVSVKHLARSLQCYLTRPDASYCGVAPNEACLLMIFQYAASPISLQYRLPLLDPG